MEVGIEWILTAAIVAAMVIVLVANAIVGSPVSNKTAGLSLAFLTVTLVGVWVVDWSRDIEEREQEPPSGRGGAVEEREQEPPSGRGGAIEEREQEPPPERGAAEEARRRAVLEAVRDATEQQLELLRRTSSWRAEAIWIQQVQGKQVVVHYTENGVYDAATVIHRLEIMGAKVSHDPVLPEEFRAEAELTYRFADFRAAQAIQAALSDIVTLELTSVGRSGTITVWVR